MNIEVKQGNTITPFIVMVIEDDSNLYPQMEKALLEEAQNKNIQITILHYVARNPACRRIRDELPAAISTDMGIPRYNDERVEPFMGVEVITFLEHRDLKVPAIIYSGQKKDVILKELSERQVDSFPEKHILEKSSDSFSHHKWARALIAMLITPAA